MWTAFVTAARSEAFRLNICVDDSYQDPWPQPATAGTTLQLVVGKDGMVNMGPYVILMHEQTTAPAVMRRSANGTLCGGGIL